MAAMSHWSGLDDLSAFLKRASVLADALRAGAEAAMARIDEIRSEQESGHVYADAHGVTCHGRTPGHRAR